LKIPDKMVRTHYTVTQHNVIMLLLSNLFFLCGDIMFTSLLITAFLNNKRLVNRATLTLFTFNLGYCNSKISDAIKKLWLHRMAVDSKT